MPILTIEPASSRPSDPFPRRDSRGAFGELVQTNDELVLDRPTSAFQAAATFNAVLNTSR
jgi:hypothetical protein